MSFTRKTTVGGFLGKSRVFCNILSIGYEFETHDLAKLSEAANTLVNSDVTAYSLRDKLKSEDAVQADKHSYDIVDNELFYSEYMEEPDDASTPAGEKAVMLQVTNDIARTAFTQRLFKECSKDVEEDIDKNDLYSFRVTPRGNKNKKKKNSSVATKATAPIFPVEFTESLQTTTCSLWTGLELIVTFYNPKTGANIILETFLDACRRIFAHIGDLRPMPGELYLRDRKVGQAKRILYHKPNTNLYYMQTPDVDKAMSIGDVLFTPQMTFRAYAHHLVPIMLEILRAATFNSNEPEIRTRVKAQIQLEYDTLSTVNRCVQRLVVEYNKQTQTTSPKHNINLSTKYGQTVVCYLVLIMYKIHVYNSEYRRDIAKIIAEKERNEIDPEEDDGSGANYLKNYLTFASRHRNYDLYVRLVDVIHSGANKHGSSISKGDAASIVAQIIDQPGVVYLFLFRRNKRALTIRLKPSHADFGNPSVSLRSYFEFMERARLVSSGNKGGRNTKLIEEEDAEEEEEEEMQQDWFSSIDQYTNTFPIGDNDELMVENRMFAQEMSYFAKTVCQIPAMSSEMSVRHLRKMYDMLVVDRNPVRFSTANIGEKEYNPRTRRHVNKKRAVALNKTKRA